MERLDVVGLHRVRASTVRALLPRELPAVIDQRELADFARRLSNLAVFDSVIVTRRDAVLHVEAREKWTLLPNFSFTTGKTRADAAFEVGAADFNFMGRASQLSVAALREQRAYGFYASFAEHPYSQRRWSIGGAVAYRSASYRFESAQGWITRTFRFETWVSSPPVLSRYVRYVTGVALLHERVDDPVGNIVPAAGYSLKAASGFAFDRYRWHDVVPSGVMVVVSAGPGFFTPAAQPRHRAELSAKLALPLARRLVLMARISAGVTARGNPNAGYLIGSIEGVRGLADSFYRNWAQVFTNVELRQAMPLFERLLLQLVLFVDAAEFQRMDARGRTGDRVNSLSCGVGARLLPTFLAAAVLRFDLARLVRPDPLWFTQLGVMQYF